MEYTIRLDEYLNFPMPNLQWVVPKMIPCPGVVVLSGKPKAGKSFLSMQLAQAVATGGYFADRRAKPGPVLYFMMESPMVWREQINELAQEGWDIQAPIYTPRPDTKPYRVNILEQGIRTWMTQCVEERDPSLVIIDPLRDIHNADEDKSTPMKEVGDWLLETFQNRALFLVHHTHKIPLDVRDPDPINSGRGSSYVPGLADSVWLLHEDKLSIIPRFAPRHSYQARRQTGGLWNLIAD